MFNTSLTILFARITWVAINSMFTECMTTTTQQPYQCAHSHALILVFYLFQKDIKIPGGDVMGFSEDGVEGGLPERAEAGGGDVPRHDAHKPLQWGAPSGALAQ
jgi:hypothetical protein